MSNLMFLGLWLGSGLLGLLIIHFLTSNEWDRNKPLTYGDLMIICVVVLLGFIALAMAVPAFLIEIADRPVFKKKLVLGSFTSRTASLSIHRIH